MTAAIPSMPPYTHQRLYTEADMRKARADELRAFAALLGMEAMESSSAGELVTLASWEAEAHRIAELIEDGAR